MVRRVQLFTVAVFAAALLHVPSASASTAGLIVRPPSPNRSVDEASAYQANAQHSGESTTVLRLPLHVRWIRNVGAQYINSPLVADGKVAVIAGSSIFALNATNGAVLWQNSSSSYWCGLTEELHVIFAATCSAPGIQALDFSSGQRLWGTVLPHEDFTAPPTVSGGVVYVSAGGAGGYVYALRAQDGDLQWATPAGEGQGTTPAIAGGAVYVSYTCPQTYALTRAGALLWHFDGPCGGGGGSVPQYYAGRLYVEGAAAAPYGTIFNAATGTVIGTFAGYEPLAFSAGVEFMVFGSIYNGGTYLQALNAMSGQILWTVGPAVDPYGTPPLVVGDVVFIEGASGTLYAYARSTGHLLQSISLGGALGEGGWFSTGLAAAQGVLIAQSGNSVVALSGPQFAHLP